ncbi:hypothetical protein LK10_02200 [Sinomonas humi]|uniref:Uncharacterized protein n=1 Tax=Sinomonas humi TaxID=1338436 RepID=A0A0B2AT53_9MICC|nr:hypothetical protein LK10_02200 [Sinomonas humi]
MLAIAEVLVKVFRESALTHAPSPRERLKRFITGLKALRLIHRGAFGRQLRAVLALGRRCKRVPRVRADPWKGLGLQDTLCLQPDPLWNHRYPGVGGLHQPCALIALEQNERVSSC